MPTIETGHGWIDPDPDQISGDRRTRQRFDVQLAVQYKILNRTGSIAGTGTTRNLSSGGVAFECTCELPQDAYVEMAIEWPVELQGGARMILEARGLIAWQRDGVAAVRVTKSQLVTQGRAVRSAGSSFS